MIKKENDPYYGDILNCYLNLKSPNISNLLYLNTNNIFSSHHL